LRQPPLWDTISTPVELTTAVWPIAMLCVEVNAANAISAVETYFILNPLSILS
jgi:hypothetical protein